MASQQTQKELVRLLVLEHGQKRASDLSQVPYETVRKWTQRGNWLSHSVPSPIQRAADTVESELQRNERETKLSLARSARRMAKDAEQATLRDSDKVHNVAKTAAIVHRWDAKERESGNVVVNIALLGVDPGSVQVKGVSE